MYRGPSSFQSTQHLYTQHSSALKLIHSMGKQDTDLGWKQFSLALQSPRLSYWSRHHGAVRGTACGWERQDWWLAGRHPKDRFQAGLQVQVGSGCISGTGERWPEDIPTHVLALISRLSAGTQTEDVRKTVCLRGSSGTFAQSGRRQSTLAACQESDCSMWTKW